MERARSSRLLRRDTVAARLSNAAQKLFPATRRQLSAATISLFFLSLFSVSAFALDVPEKPQHYVNDYIHLLSPQANQTLESTLYEFEKATSNQVAVAIFDSLEDGSLEDFSIRLADKWKIGQADKKNGVILLIFKSDHKVRIEVGYGLEGALPDVIANQIIQNDIVPYFRQGDYDGGVSKAVEDIVLAARGEYKAGPAGISDEKIKSFAPFIIAAAVAFFLAPVICAIMVVVVCVLLLGFPLGLIVGIPMAIFALIMRSFFLSPGMTYSSRRGGFGGWGGGSSGGFGSGGFGGGGGGSFGGGGSSGSW